MLIYKICVQVQFQTYSCVVCWFSYSFHFIIWRRKRRPESYLSFNVEYVTIFFDFICSDKDAADKRKLVSKWHPTTKGTLRRNYRVPSKGEGNRLLKAIASLLSDDDHFRDATSHKVTEHIYDYLGCFFILCSVKVPNRDTISGMSNTAGECARSKRMLQQRESSVWWVTNTTFGGGDHTFSCRATYREWLP